MDRFKMIASSYLLLVRDGKILLSLRKNTGYEDGKYNLPSGHVEDNESLTQAASREIFEEIGIALKPEDFTLVHVMHRKENDIRVDFFFTADPHNQEPENREPEKCDDLRWFPLNKLPVNTVGYIKQAIESFVKKQFYSERGL